MNTVSTPKPLSLEKTNLSEVPLHMRRDYVIRNRNIDEGKLLCTLCDGTGNQLFSMYQKCDNCEGKGFV